MQHIREWFRVSCMGILVLTILVWGGCGDSDESGSASESGGQMAAPADAGSGDTAAPTSQPAAPTSQPSGK